MREGKRGNGEEGRGLTVPPSDVFQVSFFRDLDLFSAWYASVVFRP